MVIQIIDKKNQNNGTKCSRWDMVFLIPLLGWGCVPELAKDCLDMTNASSTYLSLVVGAIIGGLISWWVYVRQKKTTQRQELTLKRIETLDERHDSILKRIERIELQHEANLRAMADLNSKLGKLVKEVETDDKIPGQSSSDDR